MKNNCDVSGKRTYCKTPEVVFGGCQRDIECDHRDKTDDETCTFRDKRGSCSNTAAIRAAIEAERDIDGKAFIDAMGKANTEKKE